MKLDKRAIAKMTASNIIDNIESQVDEAIGEMYWDAENSKFESISKAAVMSQLKRILNEFH